MSRALIVPFFIPHGGCPFVCVFCNQWQISGASAQDCPLKLQDRVQQYLRSVKELPLQREVAFFGGNFTGIEEELQISWLEEAAKAKAAGMINGIRLSTRPDYISDDILERLRKYGVTTIELGVQSMVDEVLIASRRGYKVSVVEEAAKKIREWGFELGFQLMPGLPGDSLDNALLTAQRTVMIRPDVVRIYPTVVLKGTTLARWYEEGKYRPWTLKEAVTIGAHWLGVFSLYGIKVIRMGLQASENLTVAKDLLAGPYQPAYGEMVKSFLMYEQVMLALKRIDKRGEVLEIICNPRDYSKVAGHKKSNLYRFKEECGFTDIELIKDEAVCAEDLKVSVGGETVEIKRQEFLEKYRISGV